MTNPKVSAIPQPTATVQSLFEVVLSLKQAVEALTGQIGPPANRAPTWQELVDIGLIQTDQIPKITDV